ncbi:hypothetical protein COOONC_20537, partial [Cooperia oncophora]
MARLQAEGKVPKSVDISQGAPTMHRLMVADNEFIVVMLDPPPCGCVRLKSGKKKRCKRHRQERRARMKENKKEEKKKKKMVKDDESDRKKAVELRHAADSEVDEDKAIEGAITPDKVAVVVSWLNLRSGLAVTSYHDSAQGPAGVAVLVDIDRVEGEEVGPRKTVDEPIRGILVKGAHETPQFIPEDKIEKGRDGQPKFRNHTKGTLVRGAHGESIFYADKQCQPDSKGNPQNVTSQRSGEGPAKQDWGDWTCIAVCPPCEVEVNENGMPVLVQIVNAQTVPKDKHATVGVLVKNLEGVVVLAQTGGQTVGARDNAECVPTTPNDNVAPGSVIGKVMEEKQTGKQTVVHATQVPGANQKAVGTVIQGNYLEPVFVKEVWVTTVLPSEAVAAVAKAEKIDKQYQPQIEKANDLVQAQIQGKTTAQIQKVWLSIVRRVHIIGALCWFALARERTEMKGATPLAPGEVYSTSLCAKGERGSYFAFAQP